MYYRDCIVGTLKEETNVSKNCNCDKSKKCTCTDPSICHSKLGDKPGKQNRGAL